MSESSRHASLAGSVAGSAVGSRAGSAAGSQAGSPRDGVGRNEQIASQAISSKAASKSVSAAHSAATSAAGSKAASSATSAAASKAASKLPSRSTSKEQSRSTSRAESQAASPSAKLISNPNPLDFKHQNVLAGKTFADGDSEVQKPSKKLKSRRQWEAEQRSRMERDPEYIARQERQQHKLRELSERIEICDHEYSRLNREGNSLEALQWLERGVWLRRERDGVGTEEVERAAHTLVGDCNSIGMSALQNKDFALSHELLNKALLLTEPIGSAQGSGLVRNEGPRRRLRAVTYNNLGCYFRKRSKLHSALQMLDKALRLELLSDQVDTPATTHLNLSAVLSQLNKHRAALEHAECAVALLQESSDPRGISGLVQALDKKPPALLAVACHNLATQLEHLNDGDTALKAYEQAARASAAVWGEDHDKAVQMRKVCEGAFERLCKQEDLEDARTRPRRASERQVQGDEEGLVEEEHGADAAHGRSGRGRKGPRPQESVSSKEAAGGDQTKGGSGPGAGKLPALGRAGHARRSPLKGRKHKKDEPVKRRSLKTVLLNDSSVSPDSSPERQTPEDSVGRRRRRRAGAVDASRDGAQVHTLLTSECGAGESDDKGGAGRLPGGVCLEPVKPGPRSRLTSPDRSATKWAAHQVAHAAPPRSRLPPMVAQHKGREAAAAQSGYGWVAHFSGAGQVGAHEAGSLEAEWVEAEESVQRVEARMKEFIRQLDNGFLQNRAARKLTNDAGEEVVRCRCSGSFGRQMLLVPVKSTLSRLMQQVRDEVALGTPPDVDPEMELSFYDTDMETLSLRSDAALRSAVADARARLDETLSLQVVTRLDRERAAADAAAAAAQKEREEAEAAEAAARRELQEAEEAERQAVEARAAAMAANASHSKEEQEAQEAEQRAENLRTARQAALATASEAAKAVKHLESQLEASRVAGDDEQVEHIREQLAAARQAEAEANKGADVAAREHAAALEDAERERREADEARRKLEADRARAEEMERVAAKERAEAEDAQRVAVKERAEYEAAQQALERSQAELQRTLDSTAEGVQGAEGGESADGAYDADREREERERLRAEEQERRKMALGADTIALNFRVYRARKQLRYRRNVRSMQERRQAAKRIQRTVREWLKSRQLRELARKKVLAKKASQAVLVQGAVRMWLARGAVHRQRLDYSRAGLFLGRYRLSHEALPEAQEPAQAPMVAHRPGPPGGGMQGLPEVGAGAVGLQRMVQERHLIEAINWRFMGEQPPAAAPSMTRLPSALARQPSAGDGARPVIHDVPKRAIQRCCHPRLAGCEHKEWLMWGVDEKRPVGHSLRRVMLRFTMAADRHVSEVRRLRALAGDREDAAGRSWPSCSCRELLAQDIHAVSVLLDVSMFIPGPGVHVIVQPAPLTLLSTQLAQLRSQGLSRELVQVLENLTVAVDLVHSRKLVMLGSLNDKAFGFLHGRWILHDLSDLRQEGQVLTTGTWNADAVPAPEAQALAQGIEEHLVADASLDMFLLGLIFFEVFVGRPLAPDHDKLLQFLQRMREEGSEADLLIGTGRCPDQVGKYILENTLTLDPRERFSANEVLINLAQMCRGDGPCTSLPELSRAPKWTRDRMATLPSPPQDSVTHEPASGFPGRQPALHQDGKPSKVGEKAAVLVHDSLRQSKAVGESSPSPTRQFMPPGQVMSSSETATGKPKAQAPAHSDRGLAQVESVDETGEDREAKKQVEEAVSKMAAGMAQLVQDESPWSKHAPVYKLASVAKETSMDALGEGDEEDDWDEEGDGERIGQWSEESNGANAQMEGKSRRQDDAETLGGGRGAAGGEEGGKRVEEEQAQRADQGIHVSSDDVVGEPYEKQALACSEEVMPGLEEQPDSSIKPNAVLDEALSLVVAGAVARDSPDDGGAARQHVEQDEEEEERRREQEQLMMARSRLASRVDSSRAPATGGLGSASAAADECDNQQ